MPADDKRKEDDAPPDFRAVARIAQRIRLSEVLLRWSQLGRFTDKDDLGEDWGPKAFLFFDSQAMLPEGERDDVNQFLVQSVFQLRYFADLDSAQVESAPEPDEENPPDVAIEAVFDLRYEINSWADTAPEDFDHFALANGTHNAWPYWREFAQSTSLRLGLHPYVVGPFKLPSRDDPSEAGKGSDEPESS